MNKSLKILTCALVLILLALVWRKTPAQTVSLNDDSVIRKNVHRIGINIGAIDYWDNGQLLKNLIGSTNPGFEPLLDQQIWALSENGSTTTFTIPDQYDTVPANYWAGGTVRVVESQTGGAELGCTATIASNSGPNEPAATAKWTTRPIITISTPCSASFAAGDQVILTKKFFPTPEAWWESGGHGGTAGTVNGSARLVSETADLCAMCGSQALKMNAEAPGSSASAAWYFDSESVDNIFVLLNGAYQLTFWAKAASGAPSLTATAARLSSGGVNCGNFTPKLTSIWAQYSWTCSASETAASTMPGNVQVSLNVTGGSILVDNVSFSKVNADAANTTIFRDEVIRALQRFYGPNSGNPAVFRYWVNQNAESLDNWTQPDYAHAPTSGGTGYFVGPNGAGTVSLSLEDYLVVCRLLKAEPYLEVPVTFSEADAGNLIEFLAGASGTASGKRRTALGQSSPWTSVFAKIHLDFCNECWNGQSFAGQSLPYRANTPNSEYYYDYSLRARDIFAAMRANPNYSASSFDLVMDAQTAVSWTMDAAIARAHPDSIEIESYTYGPVSSYLTDTALWEPAMVDPYMKTTNPSDIRNFYQSIHDYQAQSTCGPSGKSRCNVNIYEWGQNTLGGGIDQAHMDSINAGGGEAAIMALQPLLNMQHYEIGPQALFALTGYKNGGTDKSLVKIWGTTIDMGGATNNVRPSFLAAQLVNQSIIGPMYSCPINNNQTHNFGGSPNGVKPMPAMNNVPYLYAFCFENGSHRSIVLINTDLTSSHSIGFSGTHPPQGIVTQRQIAPDNLNVLNEAQTGMNTSRTAARVTTTNARITLHDSLILPPYSVTALDYTIDGTAKAEQPSAQESSPR